MHDTKKNLKPQGSPVGYGLAEGTGRSADGRAGCADAPGWIPVPERMDDVKKPPQIVAQDG